MADRSGAGPDLVLYRHVGCRYCERVVRRAREYGLDFHSRFVVPEHCHRSVVKRVSGRRTVPVLVDRRKAVTMSESANILTYLERQFGPDGRNGQDR